MACYEDLRSLYASTAKERDELRKENEQLKEICEKQAEMNGRVVAMALELDTVKAERDALKRENADLKLILDGMTIADKFRETPQTVVKKHYHDGWYHRFYCPVCAKGQKLSKTSIEKWYCERCGQALTAKEKEVNDG